MIFFQWLKTEKTSGFIGRRKFVFSVLSVITNQKSNPAGLNLELEMSVLSDLGGCWDVFFLPEVIALILYLQIGMFDPAAAEVAT